MSTPTGDSGGDKWIDRIVKLLAKAESTTPEEAEALTEKAEYLAIKYSVDRAALAAKRLGGDRPEDIIERKMEFTGIYAQQSRQLVSYIASALGNVRTFYSEIERPTRGKNGKTKWVKVTTSHMVGFQSDVEIVIMLATSLQIQCHRAELSWWKTERDQLAELERLGYGKTTAMDKFKMRRSFFIGFNDKVYERLYALHRRTVKEEETKTPGTEIALRDRRTTVDTHMAQNYRLSKGRRSTLSVTHGGFTAGAQAGATANLNQTGLGGEGRRQLGG